MSDNEYTDADPPSTSGSKVKVTKVSANIQTLVRKRAVLKRKITLLLKNIDETDQSKVKATKTMITRCLEEIEVFDSQISDAFEGSDDCDDEGFSTQLMAEIESQTKYSFDITAKLNQLESSISSSPVVKNAKQNVSNCELKLPNLVCRTFSGEGNKFLDYAVFIAEFNNIIGSRKNLDPGTKFTYLKTYLKGYAAKVVTHLSVTNDNYGIALELLEKEFLNPEAVIDEYFIKLLNLKPKYDLTYMETRVFINEIRCILSDLKIHKIDLIDSVAANKFLSHIVFSKLPVPFKRELIHKVGHNYPSVDKIFEYYVEVISTLNIKSSSANKSNELPSTSKTCSNFVSKQSHKSSPVDDTKKASDHVESRKICKLCSGNHSMLKCRKYNSHNSRVSRCNEIKLCSKCSSNKHTGEQCSCSLDFPCNICQSKEHIAALCSRFVPFEGNSSTKTTSGVTTVHASANSGSYLLPTYTIDISKGNLTTSVRCLVDSGSQRSHISSAAAKRIGLSVNKFEKKVLVSTYVDSAVRNISEMSVTLNLRDRIGDIQIPVLIDEDFSLNFETEGLSQALSNIERKYRLADSAFADERGESIQLEALLGTDVIPFFSRFTLIKCCNGAAFDLHSGVIPIGNIEHFFSLKQISSNLNPNIDSESLNDFEMCQTIDKTVVNSAMCPVKQYFDPICDACASSSDIEGNIEKLFEVESLGIKENDVSNFDEEQIAKFKSGISLMNNRYYVLLPWYPEKIKDVPSNFAIAKSVLTKVVKDLYSRKLFDAYNSVFEQQLSDGILEEIDLSKINVYNNVWIPHRPIVKTDLQVTFKVRPVLNCSLKIGNKPSLNQASYPGVDILTSLLTLLLMIRTNLYLVVSDIKQAFLQIRLAADEDKNRFSILWQNKEGSLRAFRYASIVFGLSASPFILNFVIKYHLSSFDYDKVTKILDSGFYVDNLFFSGNCIDDLSNIYA